MHVPKGFKIDKQQIRKMTREMEREFAKNPVRVPLEADHRSVSLPSATTVHNYNGPVVTVNGDHAQVAWNNHDVRQDSNASEQVAPGYEQLAQLLTDVLASLPRLGLDEADANDLSQSAAGVLREVTQEEPKPSAVRYGVTLIKGLLAPLATGLGNAVEQETTDTARDIIDALGTMMPTLPM